MDPDRLLQWSRESTPNSVGANAVVVCTMFCELDPLIPLILFNRGKMLRSFNPELSLPM